jgi:hypothetical protein
MPETPLSDSSTYWGGITRFDLPEDDEALKVI